MPHNRLNGAELDRQYSSLEAVDDLDLPDLSRLEDEQLYTAGMGIVQDIPREMGQVGRTRRQGGKAEGSRFDAPVSEGDRGRTRSEETKKDRSGFRAWRR